MLEAREVNTAEEVHEAIEKMNKGLRNFLDSKIFVQKFSEEETHVLSQYLCAGWSVDIKIPVRSPEALPVILVDLPGKTEGGLIGEFIKTMVRGSCIRASTALLVLGWENLAELDRDGADPTQRFFGGASNFSGYYMVITKVFEKDTFDQINQTVRRKAAQLKPEPLGIRFINSYLLRAHAASLAGSLPVNFPSVETDASDEERCRCEGEQHRCQIIFRGVENRLMQKKDQKKFNGKDLEEELKEKLDEFPETATFTSELYSSVDQRFPELFLGPHLERMQRHIKRLVDEICHHVEICLGSERQRQANIDACRKLLGNLDVEFMEPVKKKAWLEIQGKIEEMAEFDEFDSTRSHEETEEFHNRVCETFGPEVADWRRRNAFWYARHLYARRFVDQIKSSAERESTRAYEQILCQELAEKTHAIGPSPRDVEIDYEFFWSMSKVAGPPIYYSALLGAFVMCGVIAGAPAASVIGFAKAVLSARIYSVMSQHSHYHSFKADKSLRLEVLQAHADQNLSILSEASKGWVQKTLERRLRMLEKQLDASDVPHLEEKLQKNLQALANLQEISVWVKEEVKQRTSPSEDAGGVALSGFILDCEGAFCDDVCFVFGNLTLVIGRRCGRRRGEIVLRNS